MKRCSTCSIEKPRSEFYEDPTRVDGLEGRCKSCCVERARNYNRLKKTGLTRHEYLDLLKLQNGVCAICKEPETSTYNGKVRELAVDHDHLTNKVRALLCARCNLVLGKVNDNSHLLVEMIQYLHQYKEVTVD